MLECTSGKARITRLSGGVSHRYFIPSSSIYLFPRETIVTLKYVFPLDPRNFKLVLHTGGRAACRQRERIKINTLAHCICQTFIV